MGRNDYRGGGGGYHQGAGGGGWGGNRGGGRGGGGYAGGGGGGGGNRGGGYSGTAYQQQGRGYQGGSGARGGGGGAGRQQEPFWRDVVRADVQDERPRWVLSSYGHVREGPNDLTGDISPEEVRWANMQAGQRGMSASQLGAEHKAAEQARVQLFNQLARASKPPSLGGPALPQPSATISGLQDATASISGFSTSVGFGVQLSGAAGFAQATQPAAATAGLAGQPTGFGQAPQAGTGSGQPMFGQPPVPQQAAGFAQAVQQAPKFGQPQLPSAGFGQAAVLGQSAPGGFGGAFGAVTSKPVFGSTPFGQPAGQPSFSSTPFGQPATQPVLAPPGQPTAAGQVGGNGAIPFAGAFVSATAAPEQAVAPAGQHQAPANAAGVGNGAGNADAAVWTAAAFEKGKIPEHAPPSVYCH